MIQSAFPTQLLIDWYLHAPSHPLPTFLKELVRTGEVKDQKKLEDFLTSELQQTSLQNETGVDFFFRMYRHGLLMGYYRQDGDLFQSILETFRHRKQVFRAVDSTVPLEPWDEFTHLTETAFQRLQRVVSIETFEEKVSNVDWSLFEKEPAFIGDLSAIIGFVYRHEDSSDQHQRARIWLQKGMLEKALPDGALQQMLVVDYLVERGQAEAIPIITQVANALNQASEQAEIPEVKHLLAGLNQLVKGHLLNHQAKHGNADPSTQFEQFQLDIRAYETRTDTQHLSTALRAERTAIIGSMYQTLHHMTVEDQEQTSYSRQAQECLDAAIGQMSTIHDEASAYRLRHLRSNIAVDTGHTLTEKELKEISHFYKKRANFPQYVAAIQTYIRLLLRNGNGNKCFDLFQELFKLGQKRIDQGGFYLVTEGLRLANLVFLRETMLPGVTWVVPELAGFFERIEKAIETAETHYESIGKTTVERFREEFLQFEPASHLNILVYYKYQFAEIMIMRLGAIINGDELSKRVSDQLLTELNNESNPLNIIKAEWDDFKKVPNFVRNHTLNKCISITKGDLPAAAEHLDFSYRNLRSYITFKEVNRLGFFLDIQQTSNRQLEQGIRYMFYDLYKTGTIFEVVFDMPKFLVDYAKSGFYSQDLEEALNIKGTTAKKYIKIMIEIGLIRQDKTTGRKHYYRLIRENVMNRLGKDQNTLIESAQQG